MMAGPAGIALRSLGGDDIAFLQGLPKAELHAHLNGSIPLHTLQGLATKYGPSVDVGIDIASTIAKLQSGFILTEISDFFSLFPAIYALTATPAALAEVTHAVLDAFLNEQAVPDGSVYNRPAADCSYIELRTTPRTTVHMDREQYLNIVLQEIKSFPDRAALIISVDRRMSEMDVEECVDLAIRLHNEGNPVVGLDLCGDPLKGDVGMFERHFKRVKEAGLGLTVHIAETPANTEAESHALLALHPDRLGHATFLTEEHQVLFFADIPQPNTEIPPSDRMPWDSGHPLHKLFLASHKRHLDQILRESTESEEARMQLSFHFDADKGARRAAASEVEALMRQKAARGQYKPCIEICLTSNLLCKTVPSLEAHHIRYYLANNHPVVICTDDTLPFRTTLLAEYALLLAKPPFGLGLSRGEVSNIAEMGMGARFIKARTGVTS
ncbi:Metallo-dependent hydrolase [Gyrodon lividus]|nr:Metallo-dependent hydrolase [Gyrodon lividus]